MLRNKTTRSEVAKAQRSWLSDEYFDLFIWHDGGKQITGFQLCYDKPEKERALTWKRDQGFTHGAIDGGESKPTSNRTPVLVEGGTFPFELVRHQFIVRSSLLPAKLRSQILAKLAEYEGITTANRA